MIEKKGLILGRQFNIWEISGKKKNYHQMYVLKKKKVA